MQEICADFSRRQSQNKGAFTASFEGIRQGQNLFDSYWISNGALMRIGAFFH
jgi:hypothetical protein